MLPSVLSREIREGIKRFLDSTFPPSTPLFEGALQRLLDEPDAVFKGPYYSLRLPFRSAPDRVEPFTGLSFPYRPHLHQAMAFERLRGDSPVSTIVATGTGSGKTECFLFPLLDYCVRHPADKGIKAIVLYPMNALATDQAKRFAGAIHGDPALKGKIRVGMYVGGESDDATVMTDRWLITSRAEMRSNPPDILLTNYKMLDYLLIRPDDADLWSANHAETLKFICVDELHTFDGAQATDLACLLRRLKDRLHTPEEYLCCVGTSATIGSGDEVPQLLSYASTLFGESFEPEVSVIREHLLSQAEFSANRYIRHTSIPGAEARDALRPGGYADRHAYLRGQYGLWFDREAPEDLDDLEWRVTLGEELLEHSLLRNLLVFIERRKERQVEERVLLHELAQLNPDLTDEELAFQVFDSLCSLCSFARYRHPETGAIFPFLKIHVHLWFRELSRMVATVRPLSPRESDDAERLPHLRFSSELKKEELEGCLPVIHCRDCGTMGWGATQRVNDERLTGDLDKFYQCFFSFDPKLRFVIPREEGSKDQQEFPRWLCGHCLTVSTGQLDACPGCGREDRLVAAEVHASTTKAKVKDRITADRSCPSCHSRTGLTILGSRSASLCSVALGQAFATRFNDDKQTLAFSDNVQDASHRASFFAARTYRTTLRTAISEALAQQAPGIALDEFEQAFLDYWRSRYQTPDFVGTFLAPNMEWLEDYEVLKEKGSLSSDSDLPGLVEKRLRWEITAEFGFQARIGRTLEKSGAAIGYPDPEAVRKAVIHLASLLQEVAGGFGSIAESDLTALVLGLLHRLRTIGGVRQSLFDGYFHDGAEPFVVNRKNWAPGFSKKGRLPSGFVMGSAKPGNLERVVSTGGTPSWLQRWAMKCIKIPGSITKELSEMLIEKSLAALTAEQLLDEATTKNGNRLWLLRPASVRLSIAVNQCNCDTCGHQISVETHSEGDLWEGIPCMRGECVGRYTKHREGLNYFGELYRQGDVARIHAEEHTGLIERPVREQIERRFMATQDRRTTDPNLLSCTPTLEMGIDIGDLSTVLLCSVPPATANYLQRVGRAGRKDGNAFSLTVANAQAHDLYFYGQPDEMMDGEVSVPGVFLDAPAVLERQFLAFCFDRWIAGTKPRPVVPRKIDAPLKNVLSPPSPPSGFPYDLLSFIKSKMEILLQDFAGLFEQHLSESSKEDLRRFAKGDSTDQGSLPWKLLGRLRSIADEREDLRQRRTQVRNRLNKLQALPAKDEVVLEEIEELTRTAKGLGGIIRTIGETETFKFFTDEGLLPNYAFPEEGVTLRSVILRKRVKKSSPDQGNYTSETLEYQRPAASAIRELAPGSHFYAQHRRLTVDQVNLRLSPPELWNFCDQCAYIERLDVGAPARTTCPVCGSGNWADISMRRKMVPMRQVMTTEFDRNSRTRDESDERTPEFFDHEMSVAIPDSEIQKAYQLEDSAVPFGFEFIRLATLRSINLGSGGDNGQVIRLAGRERTGSGFRLCPKCGKVQGARPREKEFRHDIACPLRDKGSDPDALEAFYLYRELVSEAVRVLVPSVGGEDNVELTSFVTALQLGLSEHFSGNIDHLGSCLETRPIPETSFRRTYVVIYDRVPGGTGYLKQLSQDATTLLGIFQKAYDLLKSCGCQKKPELDGCHRCVLRNQRHGGRHAPSRSAALRILENILSQGESLVQISSLSAIDLNPLLESQLEQRFLEVLSASPGASLRTEVIDGKDGFHLRLEEHHWEIIPQVEIEASPEIPLATRPDFVLRPVRKSLSLPIAVYLDGFAYHADAEGGHNRVGKDIAQREGLRHSGKWRVWSLGWQDLDEPESDEGEDFSHPGMSSDQRQRYQGLASDLTDANGHPLRGTYAAGSWKLLINYLQNPKRETWQAGALCLLMSIKPPSRTSSEATHERLVELLASVPSDEGPASLATGDHLGFEHASEDSRWRCLVSAPITALQSRAFESVQALIRFDDMQQPEAPDFRRAWLGLLRLQNLLQFLPRVFFATTLGLFEGHETRVLDLWDGISAEAPDVPEPDVDPGSAAWAIDRDLIHPDLHPLLDDISVWSREEPECGFELLGEAGSIVAEAELAWPDRKVVLLMPDQSFAQPQFERSGWIVLVWSAQTSTLNQLKQTLLS